MAHSSFKLSDTSCNVLWVILLNRHRIPLPTKSKYFTSLKAAQNLHSFIGLLPCACPVIPKNTLFYASIQPQSGIEYVLCSVQKAIERDRENGYMKFAHRQFIKL